MHIHRDTLTILTVTELVESNPLSQFEDFLHAQIKFNEELEKHSAALVAECVAAAVEAKVGGLRGWRRDVMLIVSSRFLP